MKCWICGENADSMEHKFKSSDLKKAFGSKFHDKVVIESDSKSREVRGKNSVLVKFKKSICKNCNGVRTQKHDNAYDLIVDYILENAEELMKTQCINLTKIYDQLWQEGFNNLTKYISKHIGCILTQSKLELNLDCLKSNILNNSIAQHVLLKFQIKEGTNFLLKHLLNDNEDGQMFFHGDSAQIKYDGDKWIFHGWISINQVTIQWFYSPFLEFSSKLKSNIIQLQFQKFDFNGAAEDCDKLLWCQEDEMRTDEERIRFVHNMIKEYR